MRGWSIIWKERIMIFETIPLTDPIVVSYIDQFERKFIEWFHLSGNTQNVFRFWYLYYIIWELGMELVFL